MSTNNCAFSSRSFAIYINQYKGHLRSNTNKIFGVFLYSESNQFIFRKLIWVIMKDWNYYKIYSYVIKFNLQRKLSFNPRYGKYDSNNYTLFSGSAIIGNSIHHILSIWPWKSTKFLCRNNENSGKHFLLSQIDSNFKRIGNLLSYLVYLLNLRKL